MDQIVLLKSDKVINTTISPLIFNRPLNNLTPVPLIIPRWAFKVKPKGLKNYKVSLGTSQSYVYTAPLLKKTGRLFLIQHWRFCQTKNNQFFFISLEAINGRNLNCIWKCSFYLHQLGFVRTYHSNLRWKKLMRLNNMCYKFSYLCSFYWINSGLVLCVIICLFNENCHYWVQNWGNLL